MDISKIRKKAREQEGSKEEKPVESPAEPVEALTEEIPDVEKPVSESAESLKEEDRGEGREVVEEVTPGEDGIVELLTFSLSGGEFAFRVSEVEEIIKYQKATRVPSAA